MMQLIDAFKESGYRITFASAAVKSPHTADLNKPDIEQKEIELNSSSFDEFVSDLNPGLVLFDRFMTEEQFGWRVAEKTPDAIRILDTEDLHCLRFGRHQALKEGREFTNSDLFTDVAKREIASIYRCDLSLIISEKEMEILQNVFRVDKNLVYHLPFMFEPLTINEIEKCPGFSERNHFMTIGNFLHEPNRDSAFWLKNTIWPLIRKELPDAEMHLYGAYPSQQIEQLHKPEVGFIVKGRAESSAEVISNAKVMLAPLRFGAGLKGKLAEAMLCCTPSVTTTIGAESMHGIYKWPGFLADDPEDVASAAVRLFQNEKLWSESQKRGMEIINNLYPAEKLKNDFLKRVDELRDNIESHRLNNFTGAMLMHHSMNSVKYMAKWIEEKNRGN